MSVFAVCVCAANIRIFIGMEIRVESFYLAFITCVRSSFVYCTRHFFVCTNRFNEFPTSNKVRLLKFWPGTRKTKDANLSFV